MGVGQQRGVGKGCGRARNARATTPGLTGPGQGEKLSWSVEHLVITGAELAQDPVDDGPTALSGAFHAQSTVNRLPHVTGQHLRLVGVVDRPGGSIQALHRVDQRLQPPRQQTLVKPLVHCRPPCCGRRVSLSLERGGGDQFGAGVRTIAVGRGRWKEAAQHPHGATRRWASHSQLLLWSASNPGSGASPAARNDDELPQVELGIWGVSRLRGDVDAIVARHGQKREVEQGVDVRAEQ